MGAARGSDLIYEHLLLQQYPSSSRKRETPIIDSINPSVGVIYRINKIISRRLLSDDRRTASVIGILS